MSQTLQNKELETKSEVVAAYDELLRKLKETNKTATPAQEQEYEEKNEIVVEMTSQTPMDWSKQFENLQSGLNAALEEVKSKFLAEQERLTTIADSIEFKKRELSQVHDIEVGLNTLTALVMAHKEKSAEFDREMQERQQSFEQEMQMKRREWQQEEQKYLYQRDLSREKDRNQYEVAKRNLEQELAGMRLDCLNEIEGRRSKISHLEHEVDQLVQLKEKVGRFPEEMRQAVASAEESLTRQLTQKFDFEKQILQKDIKIHEQTIASLENKINTLESKISQFESLKNSLARLSFGDEKELVTE